MTPSFKKIICYALIALFLHHTAFAAGTFRITDYHQVFFPRYNLQGELRVVIRVYYRDKTLYYLVVNPFTFATETKSATDYTSRNIATNQPELFTMQALQETPYLQALQKYTSPPYHSQNDGITHAEKTVDGVFLTADMCPSLKPFEDEFFNQLISMAEKNQQPMPIALAITGLWIIHHPKEFHWLIEQEKENKLKITWVNHSFSHVYYADLPIKQNFLLSPYTNISHEILATEKLLLEHDQLPSVFFRFPGLISNEKLLIELRHYGLIPIGSDAWLAKNQKPKMGSIILIHANSNEPEGIQKVMPLLQDKNYHWLSLDDAFSHD